MGIQYYKEPKLEKPWLIACWPGLGNIGTIAAENLIRQTGAEELAEIEAWDFFYPQKVSIKSGVLENLEFPSNKFYYKKLEQRDFIIFNAEEQPADDRGTYSQGKKAFEMGNLVLDVAEKFSCQRIYTSCAAIASTHHRIQSGVWAVTSHEYLKKEVKGYPSTVLMSDVEGRGQYSTIPGIKGLLLGLAKSRGLEAICLMGEIPDYLVRVPLPYPRASRAVLEVMGHLTGVRIDYTAVDEMIGRLDGVIDNVVEQFSPEIKERIAQRKTALQAKPETITQEDEKWIKDHLDELFKPGGSGGG